MDKAFAKTPSSGDVSVSAMFRHGGFKSSRREMANSNERKRMQQINQGFELLKTCVPNIDDKHSKASILARTTDYIVQLRHQIQHLEAENESLRTQLSQPPQQQQPPPLPLQQPAMQPMQCAPTPVPIVGGAFASNVENGLQLTEYLYEAERSRSNRLEESLQRLSMQVRELQEQASKFIPSPISFPPNTPPRDTPPLAPFVPSSGSLPPPAIPTHPSQMIHSSENSSRRQSSTEDAHAAYQHHQYPQHPGAVASNQNSYHGNHGNAPAANQCEPTHAQFPASHGNSRRSSQAYPQISPALPPTNQSYPQPPPSNQNSHRGSVASVGQYPLVSPSLGPTYVSPAMRPTNPNSYTPVLAPTYASPSIRPTNPNSYTPVLAPIGTPHYSPYAHPVGHGSAPPSGSPYFSGSGSGQSVQYSPAHTPSSWGREGGVPMPPPQPLPPPAVMGAWARNEDSSGGYSMSNASSEKGGDAGQRVLYQQEGVQLTAPQQHATFYPYASDGWRQEEHPPSNPPPNVATAHPAPM